MTDSALYRNLLDNVPMGVFVVDCQRRVCLWNRWLAELTGITEEAAIGNTFRELFPGLESPRFEWGLEQALRNSSPQLLSQALNEFLIPISATCRGRNGLCRCSSKFTSAPSAP